MLLGIMTRMLVRPTLEDVAEVIRAYGFDAVQLNLHSAGLPSLPDELTRDLALRIGDIFRERELAVAAISANFNAIHPDPATRAEGIRRAGVLASRCEALGTRILTLCTGTRNADDMWRSHPDNADPSAWRDLLQTTRHLLRFAEEYNLMLVFEPEVVNVIDSAAKAERLLEEVNSPRLRVLLDPANLIGPQDLPDTRPVLRDMFQRLGPYIALAHAKDVAPPLPGDKECRRVTAGQGRLDYAYYLAQLEGCGFNGALILHDLDERDIAACRSMLQDRAAHVF